MSLRGGFVGHSKVITYPDIHTSCATGLFSVGGASEGSFPLRDIWVIVLLFDHMQI